jgi:hypothetical protein
VHVQAVLAPGRPFSPDVGQQTAAWNNRIRMQQKNGEDRALLRAAKGKLFAVLADLKRSKKPELH